MRFRQVFDELDHFVAAYRGAISQEGMLLSGDIDYPEGTVLNIEIMLEDTLPLICGTAGVVKLVPGDRSDRQHNTVVLEFLQLDEESAGFIDRLVTDFESKGVAPFSFYQYLEQGRRGLRRARAAPFDDGVTPLPFSVSAAASSKPTIATAVESEEGGATVIGSKHRAVWRWLLGVAASCAVIVGLAALGAGIWPQIRAPRATPPSPFAPFVPVAHGRIDVTAPPLSADAAAGATSGVQGPLAEPTTHSPSPAVRDGQADNIERVDWTESRRDTVVTVEADGVLDGAAVGHFLMMDDPRPRLIIYLYGIGSNGLAYRTEVGGRHLAAIRVWYHDDKTPVQLHIVLDFAHRDVVSRAPVLDGNRLTITLFDGSEADSNPSP
jgi:hypothetical protein